MNEAELYVVIIIKFSEFYPLFLRILRILLCKFLKIMCKIVAVCFYVIFYFATKAFVETNGALLRPIDNKVQK